MNSQATLLLVEDSQDDIFLMQRALKSAGIVNKTIVVDNGKEAVDYLQGGGKYQDRIAFPVADIVLLDVKLPYMSGFEILQWIRSNKETRALIVIMLTSSNQPADIRRAYELGANSYVVKPSSFEQLLGFANAFRQYWLCYNDVTRMCSGW
jgi:CheY-like chemotaxis protein